LKTSWYHLIALLIVTVWGTTFVSTKVLLIHGLLPQDIFFYRFLLAYAGIWFFGRTQLLANSLKDEFLFLLMGVTGGSFYFIAENTALGITQASNVALLVSTAPILTAISSRLFLKTEKLNRYLWYGSLLALAGVAFVAFNGRFLLRINPLGDMLSLLAALSWALYTIVLKRIGNRYSTFLITRKVFFYGILTLLPLFLHKPLNVDTEVLIQPVVWANLLYLSVVASLFCYFLWNMAVKKLGAVRTTTYVYVIPLVTLLTSVIVLNETITLVAMAGALLILAGVALAER
jgi:drug/metabolite transporter (DMT)-like permease